MGFFALCCTIAVCVASADVPRLPLSAEQVGAAAVAVAKANMAMSPCFAAVYATLDCELPPHSDAARNVALALANRHLTVSGRATHTCGGAAGFTACMRDAPPEVFATYTNFALHVENLCFNAKVSTWHETLKNTTASLAAGQAAMLVTQQSALAEAAEIETTLVTLHALCRTWVPCRVCFCAISTCFKRLCFTCSR